MSDAQVGRVVMFALALVACSGRRQAAWGEAEPEAAPTETAKPRAPVGEVICETPTFLNVKLGKQRELPPWNSVQRVHLIQDQPAGQAPIGEDDLREIFESAAPLDSCDPSIGPWQYAPGTSGTVRLKSGEDLHVQLYMGARGVVVWPDGKGVMFDYGPAAPWLPKEMQPYVHRDWKRDKECVAGKVQPHFITFSPDPKADPKAGDALARMCAPPKKGAPPSEWCCP